MRIKVQWKITPKDQRGRGRVTGSRGRVALCEAVREGVKMAPQDQWVSVWAGGNHGPPVSAAALT